MKLRKELDEISEIVDKIVSSICIVLTAIMFVAGTLSGVWTLCNIDVYCMDRRDC